MVEGWIKVFSGTEEYQAEVIKNLLVKHGYTPFCLIAKTMNFVWAMQKFMSFPKKLKRHYRQSKTMRLEVLKKNRCITK